MACLFFSLGTKVTEFITKTNNCSYYIPGLTFLAVESFIHNSMAKII